MSRVALVTLGCAKNAVDSEGLGGLLDEAGHEVGEEPEGAEIVVVNTCGFIDAARRETIDEVLDLGQLKREGRLKGLVLAGCLVARAAPELAESLPEVDALVDFTAYPRIGSIVNDLASGVPVQRIHGNPGTRFEPAWWDASMARTSRLRFGRPPWAYLKIAEGCDRACTFCAIPLMRGKLRSRSLAQIEAEARHLVAQGVSELSLVSQDSVMWGRDTAEGSLPDLLRSLDRIEGLARVRLMYLHPQGVNDELIDVMFETRSVVPYFDLSLQHVAPGVLKAMGRWGSEVRFERLIERIRAADPLAAVRATFILGFPGETDEEAEAVERFVVDAGLDWIATFTFSREEGTRSHDLPDQVPGVVARERAARVAASADAAMAERASALVGARRQVLVERYLPEEDGWSGRSAREAPEVDGEIRFTADRRLRVGDYVDVRITEADGADLLGRLAATEPASTPA